MSDKRYAIKIGEIHLSSDKPITDEQREKALKDFARNRNESNDLVLDAGDGFKIELRYSKA